MQIIKQNTSYALRALLHMAGFPEDTSFTAEELADVAGTSPDFMRKIMQSLRQSDLVVSRRGPGGGFRLRRAVEDITLLDAATAVQGPFAVSRCIIGLDMCDRSAACPLRATWLQVQGLIEGVLRDTTLADVMEATGDAGS